MKKTNYLCKGKIGKVSKGYTLTPSKEEPMCNCHSIIFKGLRHHEDSCQTKIKTMNLVSKLSTTFIHHETHIKAEVNEDTGNISLFTGTKSNRYGRSDDEFVFRDSKPETILKVANALLDIVKAIK